MNRKAREIIIHIIGCLTFLALPIVFRPGSTDNFDVFNDPRSRSDLMSYLLLIVFFYLNYFIFVPALYLNKKYFYFLAVVILCFFIISYFPDFIIPFKHAGPPPPPKPKGDGFFLFQVGKVFFLFLISFFLSLLLRINLQWKQAEEEKLKSQLSYLRAQINPHFLFNTLNSIYSMAIMKSDDTPAAVVKLSEMMRYVTSESNKDFVSLEKEMAYIFNYIDLQKIRFGKVVEIVVNVQGETKGHSIAPLILIPFVENAFKHGINAEENSKITIHIIIEERNLHLMVSNNKVVVHHAEEIKSGLGIENTRGRLQLVYPGKHMLIIHDNEKDFFVSLTLHLK
ncbi:MAG: sensor histidine kinase [Chryseolinea sp.]